MGLPSPGLGCAGLLSLPTAEYWRQSAQEQQGRELAPGDPSSPILPWPAKLRLSPSEAGS